MRLVNLGSYALVTCAALLVLVAAAWYLVWYQRGIAVMSVQSSSMAPAIRKGDVIIAARITPTAIRPGDVVTYPDPRNPAVLLTHRVVSADSFTGRLVTKGDANRSVDPVTSTLFVSGKVTNIIPGAGWLLEILRSWPGIIGLVYLPSIFVLATEIRRLVVAYAGPTYVLRR